MITHKHAFDRTARTLPGFASILVVISVGLSLMILLVYMYRDTIQCQDIQKNNLLRNDYQQREDAFLRALTNIIPNKAMQGMMEGASSQTDDFNWEQIFTEALEQSNVSTSISIEDADKSALGLDSMRFVNTANTQKTLSEILNSVFKESATAPIIIETNVSSDSTFPVISHTTPNITTDDFSIITPPTLNFNYSSASTLIAKHSWWTFNVALSKQDKATTNLERASKKYRISLYELPAVLAINSSAFTNLGEHSNNSSWDSSKITIAGGVMTGGAKTKGNFTLGPIASRKGIELSDASNPMAIDNADRNSHLYKGGAATSYSSSSDAGMVSFVPINTGDDFYVRNLPLNKMPIDNFTASSATTADSTAWDFYSRGANQCVMSVSRDSGGDYTFYYKVAAGTNLSSVLLSDNTCGITLEGDAIDIDMELLAAFLGTDVTTNNSLFIDLTNHDWDNDADPDNDVNYARFFNATDLSSFSSGFSLVVNKTLIVDGDVNTTDVPLSLFSKKTRYGSRYYKDLKIDFEGQLGSNAKNTKDTAVDVVDLKITGNDVEHGGDGSASYGDVTATLKPITTIDKLPPINMMNWMVVIQEVHKQVEDE